MIQSTSLGRTILWRRIQCTVNAALWHVAANEVQSVPVNISRTRESMSVPVVSNHDKRCLLIILLFLGLRVVGVFSMVHNACGFCVAMLTLSPYYI